jgi:hypothetical protein
VTVTWGQMTLGSLGLLVSDLSGPLEMRERFGSIATSRRLLGKTSLVTSKIEVLSAAAAQVRTAVPKKPESLSLIGPRGAARLNRVGLTTRRSLLVFPDEQTLAASVGMSQK